MDLIEWLRPELAQAEDHKDECRHVDHAISIAPYGLPLDACGRHSMVVGTRVYDRPDVLWCTACGAIGAGPVR